MLFRYNGLYSDHTPTHTLIQTFTTLLHTPIKYGLYMYMHTTELTEWCAQNGMISSCVPLQSDWLYCNTLICIGDCYYNHKSEYAALSLCVVTLGS